MATDSKLDVSLWERFSDSLSGFSEGVGRFLSRLFGSSNERATRALGFIRPRGAFQHTVVPGSLLYRVNELEPAMAALSDEELKGKTAEFRQRLADGATLDDLLPEAFAACREAGKRAKNMRHFDVQIVGGIVLHRGNIAEMVTGEGKTLVATLPAYLNALEGKGVHVVTVNDYLARRDCEWMSPIYHALGITAGFIQSDMDPAERRRAYDCDITYGTNSEFGFDYLRDNMKPARWGDDNYPTDAHQCQKELNFAIIDEVDNILIDEARTPLIISGPAFGDLRRYARANDIVLQLNELQKREPGKYFEVKEKEHTCHLTDDGVRKAEELAGVESFYTAGNMEWPHLIDNALKAHHLYHKDKQYVVMRHPETGDMSVIIVDEFTGRLMIGRQWSDGLHQAVEAKHAREGVKIKEETQTLATVTLQNFFKLYKKLAGMTGTAMTEANEFWKIYKLDVIAIPTNKPLVRVDYPDMIYLTEKEKWAALVEEIERMIKWDVVRLADGTEIVGTVKREETWDIFKLRDGTELVGKVKAEHGWDVLKMADGSELVGTLGDESETEETAVLKLKDTGEERTIKVADVASHEEREEIDFQVKGGERRTLSPADVVSRTEDGEVEILPKEGGDKRVIPMAQIDKYDPRGRPILIGTTNVDKSEKLAALLKKRGIKHELLNAKPEYAAREAEIVAQAGRINAVTISTNMAGRGTDIVLGGNAEFLAWARLKDKYATRLDVPREEWLAVIADIEAKEKLKEEGRRVAQMGGLHVLGTERHEARRIDNQLRGRGGRQGDPGSTRFYLSLQDDLMRIFAGDWVAGLLQRMGMEEGQAIESRMVSRRIEAAQKKVEERNFDIRRNLLEYDEVMDHQRKSIYGYRQSILDATNCKLLICEMLQDQIDQAVDRFTAPNYGEASFAEYAGNRLAVEFRGADFHRMTFDQAEAYAKDRAAGAVETQIHDAMEENLNPDAEDQREWNWQALSSFVSSRWGLKLNERQLKQIGRDNLAEYLKVEAVKVIEQVDLTGGKKFLDPEWGLRSVCDWAKYKFGIKAQPEELRGQEPGQIKGTLFAAVQDLYKEKDLEFPVKIGMARFMSDRGATPGVAQRYNREGLFRWAQERFTNLADVLSEQDFHTESRPKIQEKLLEASHKLAPAVDQFGLDEKLDEVFAGGLTEAAAEELSSWLRSEVKLEVSATELLEAGGYDEARQLLWNVYDHKYRPEMCRMERSLLLSHVDTSWKNHLYVMDHLRQGIGLVGYAQEDPKTVYKQEGMKMFDEMWAGLRDKISDTIFRMEDTAGFEESVWSITEARHDAAASMPAPAEGSIEAQQQAAIAGTQGEKKVEPIRNRGKKVGRNDPCPCGSGKKYKQCCMRTTA